MQTVISQWLADILKGIQGGHPVLRLASCSGLLLGVEDLRIGRRSEKKEGIDVGSTRSLVEDETVIALAEVMDTYSHSLNSGVSPSGVEEWEREFEPAGQGTGVLPSVSVDTFSCDYRYSVVGAHPFITVIASRFTV